MDKTPKTELEIFLSKELETAQKELLNHKLFIIELKEDMEKQREQIDKFINNIEVTL